MSYNIKELLNRQISFVSGKLAAFSLITAEQHKSIRENFTSRLYSPSVFVRIGLFIFTMILIFAASGILAITISDLFDNEITIGVLMILAAGVMIGILEYFINQKKHYKSGIDDCLLFAARQCNSFCRLRAG